MMFTSVALIVICTGIIYLISNYLKWLRFVQVGNALPGPKPRSIIGNVYYFLKNNFDEMLNSTYLLVDKYPSPFRVWLGNKLFIGISEPDQIKIILQNSSCLNKSAIYKPFRELVGMGIFTAPAHIWIHHRKMLVTSFNTNMLRIFCDIFVQHVSVFMEKVECMVNADVDFFHHIANCTLDMICDTSLNINRESQLKKNEPLINSITRLKEIVIHRMRNIFLFPDIIFNLTSLSREQQKHINFLNSVTEEIILQKENARNNLIGNKTQSAKPSKKIFLDILMETSDESKNFTQKEIIDEINTIIIAGSDTIAITLNFMMFILANFQEIQQKVYEELLGIYGTQNQDPKSTQVKYEDLQHMNYLECVIKETLRLFPAVPGIVRRLDENLQIGDYILPKGVEIGIPIYALHRNEKYWPKALTFDPERFLPENMKNIYSYSYIPFSNGPRNCIGIRYAMTSMKVFIATLLRTYKLKVDKKVKIEEIELKMNITLVPVKPLEVRIEKRK
ncbi:cytochrome P450 4C1-like [Odontomachus brunneus]|uniref:cytochrome P450 4C1-like n=1 Tax=Odontomachus brunneus TaxID=486640 RepID=UPI0013F1827B|nr:cytochrome P450 4C1-like [Odontomachus brunneus]XP_032687032.1 cytochrome P450 4C1-like [Odontomachus brunneus]XP_032687033.1 cytochrome P450 4C1-like [Odontomachus brunneus]XP_032687034.1 cytochrome P450 4C1-like [Odontomachus brunneus]